MNHKIEWIIENFTPEDVERIEEIKRCKNAKLYTI